VEKFRKERPKIQQQFTDLKRELVSAGLVLNFCAICGKKFPRGIRKIADLWKKFSASNKKIADLWKNFPQVIRK
jgi:hypothetical protein